MPITENRKFIVDIYKREKEGQKDRIYSKHSEKLYGSALLKTPFSDKTSTYICVEKNDSFTVKVASEERKDDKTYGAILYLDGQRIHGKKTFKGVSSFLGYKLGEGNYREF